MNCALALRMLDAHLDRELDAATTAEIVLHLTTCAVCRSALDRRVALRSALGSAALRHAAPPGLRRSILHEIGDTRPRGTTVPPPRWWQAIALSASAAVLGTIGGWWLAQPHPVESLPELAVARHVASLAPEGPRIDVASSDRHVVRPWFQGRLDFAPAVRDLSEQGFDLVGGRVDRLGEQQAVAVVYRLRGHVISVFSWRAPPGIAAAGIETTVRGFRALTWRSQDLSYAAVSDTDIAELQRFAAAYRGP